MSERLTEIVDRHGFVHARLAWREDALDELRVPTAIVRGAVVDDPLLGRVHEILAGEPARVVTAMSAIDWARPTEIPAIAAPGALPPGAGGAIMNVLAILAQRAGVTALRYAGPYPTSALYATLARSFTTTTSEAELTSAFAERAARVARDPMAAVFVPAPHERLAIASADNPSGDDNDVRGVVELRAGIERATIDGVVFARGDGTARLVDQPGEGVRAEVWFGDVLYAHVATFALTGELAAGLHPLPRCDSNVLGTVFPADLVAVLAELVADFVPAGLAHAATAVVAGHTLRWADLGARAAARVGDELHVHAALWRLAAHGMARLAMALVEALVPIASPLATMNILARRT